MLRSTFVIALTLCFGNSAVPAAADAPLSHRLKEGMCPLIQGSMRLAFYGYSQIIQDGLVVQEYGLFPEFQKMEKRFGSGLFTIPVCSETFEDNGQSGAPPIERLLIN